MNEVRKLLGDDEGMNARNEESETEEVNGACKGCEETETASEFGQLGVHRGETDREMDAMQRRHHQYHKETVA